MEENYLTQKYVEKCVDPAVTLGINKTVIEFPFFLHLFISNFFLQIRKHIINQSNCRGYFSSTQSNFVRFILQLNLYGLNSLPWCRFGVLQAKLASIQSFTTQTLFPFTGVVSLHRSIYKTLTTEGVHTLSP